MRNDRRGYTLIELVVVVLIIGILASIGVPQYLKTVEVSKADDAVTTVNMIGSTNRMFALDHQGNYAYGQLTAACGNTTACPAAPPFSNACALVWCKYLGDQDWGTRPYSYAACNGAASASCSTASGAVGGGYQVSAAMRKPPASSPYDTWAYGMNTSGQITGYGTSPAPPTY